MRVQRFFIFSLIIALSLFTLPFPYFSVQIAFAKTEQSNSYRLQAGDRLEITVYREEDLSGIYEIDPAGALTFPLVGEMKVLGLRIDELLERLNWNLRKYLTNPQVSVSRNEATIKSISVLGQVKKPGTFTYTPGLTLMRLISQAGGFERVANKRKIRIVRIVEGKKESSTVNGSAIINGQEDDPVVESGDMVFVPEAIF